MSTRRMRELYAQRAREQEKLNKAKLYCIICDKELNGGQEIIDHAINFIRNPDFESILKVHSIFVNEKKEISRSEFDYFNILFNHSKWRMNGYTDPFYQELKKSICKILLNPRANSKIYYNKPDEDLEFLTTQFKQNRLLEIEEKVKKISDALRGYKEMIDPDVNIPKEILEKIEDLQRNLNVLAIKRSLSKELYQTIRELNDSINSIFNKSSSNKEKSSSNKVKSSSYKVIDGEMSVLVESLVFEDRNVELLKEGGSIKFRLESSIHVLNDIKNEYFGEQVFKFYLKNNQVIKEESPGYKLLEEKIKSYRIAKKSNKKTLEPINIINKKLNGDELIDILNNQAFKNIYLKEAAQRLKMKTDFVVAFEENNNGTKEQGLLFVFKRTTRPGMEKSFILYENSREDRAAYLFRVRENYSESFIKNLLTFAQSDQRNKRDSLLREKYNDLKIDRVKCWKVIKHNSAEHYSNELDRWV